MRDAASNESAISAPPITAWIAFGNGPPTFTTDDNITEPLGGVNCCVLPPPLSGAELEPENIERNDDTMPPPAPCPPQTRSGLRAVGRFPDDESAAAGVFLADQFQAGRDVLEPLDEHVLQQVAETRLDGALVPRLDLDEVRHRAHLPDPAVGVDEHHARRIGEAAAMRVDFLERVQARGHAGELLLARADIARSPFVLEPRARQFGFTRRPGHARGFEAILRAMQRFRGGHALRAGPFELDVQLARFEIETRRCVSTARSRCVAAESCAAVSAVIVLRTA